LFAQAFDVGLGAFLSQHVVDGITDKAEHGKRDQPDDEQDKDRLSDPAEDVGQHPSSPSPSAG
jgi:hypothetical protein